MSEKTAAVFRPNGFFIAGGDNVYPKEIEEILDSKDGVVESAVVGLPDPDFGERMVAAVKPKGEPCQPII